MNGFVPQQKTEPVAVFMRGCFSDIIHSVKPQYPGWTALYPGWTARSPPDLCDRLLEGAVPGIAEENGQSSDVVHLDAVQRCWFLSEDALKATGRFDRRETFYNGSHLIVTQDGEILD